MTRGVPSGFDIHDVITRLVPGGLLAGYFIVNSVGYKPFLDGISNQEIIFLFILLSYIMGESIDHIRRTYFPTPYLFQRILYFHDNDPEMLGRADRIRLKMRSFPIIGGISKPNTIMDSLGYDFVKELKEDIPKFDSLTDREIYLLFTRIIDDSTGSDTARYESIYVFVINTQVSVYLAGAISIIGLLTNSTAGLVGPVSAILLGPLMVFYIIFMFKRIDDEYIDHLCLDYLEQKNSLKSSDTTLEKKDILQ